MTLSRRELLLSSLALALPPAKSEMSVEGYIFQQYSERSHKQLGEIIAEVLPMAKSAGFTNIELNPAFFTPDIRDKTIAMLSSLNFRMPSIYVGGNLHSQDGASKTIDSALQCFRMAAPFGCKALVTNPDPKSGDQQKTDDELKIEAESLNRMGRALGSEGCELRVHHHTPQLENGAREWRSILAHTDPKLVTICVDVDWAYEGGFQPVPFLEAVGSRLREIHVRSARNKIWLEDVEDSDIDYHEVAAYLRNQNLHPLVVVELAYRTQTIVTRSLQDDLRLSRIYTERVLNLASGNHVGL
jgi:inosose dehydratase